MENEQPIDDIMIDGQAPRTEPLVSVGIFWGVPGRDGSLVLVTDQTPLHLAEEYGEFLTHPRGHYEVWEAWRRLGLAGLVHRQLPHAILWHEYEECPRGRIVYLRLMDEFIVYADKRLQGSIILADLLETFGLTDRRFKVKSDVHYR